MLSVARRTKGYGLVSLICSENSCMESAKHGMPLGSQAESSTMVLIGWSEETG